MNGAVTDGLAGKAHAAHGHRCGKFLCHPCRPQDQRYQNILHRRRQMGKRVDNAHPDSPKALGRADGPVFPGYGREKAEDYRGRYPDRFRKAHGLQSRHQRTGRLSGKGGGEGQGDQCFPPDDTHAGEHGAYGKGHAAIQQPYARPADGIKNKVIQRVRKEPVPVSRQKMDQQAPQEQAGPSALRAYQQDRGAPQQAEQQPCAGVRPEMALLSSFHYATPAGLKCFPSIFMPSAYPAMDKAAAAARAAAMFCGASQNPSRDAIAASAPAASIPMAT